MRDVAVIALPLMAHQVQWCGAMANGIRRHGCKVTMATAPVAGVDATVCWGWRVGRQVEGDVLVLERGYVGDRLTAWASAGWNGLNGRARFAAINDGGARWRAHFADVMRPWRADQPGLALVIGQVPGDQALDGIDHGAWCARMISLLDGMGYAVRFRPHPMVRDCGRTLQEDLAAAELVVTWNSNTGVDAALAGVPVVAMDEGAIAWDVAAHGLDDAPIRPDRTAWAHNLAWRQWRIEELEDGTAWEALRP